MATTCTTLSSILCSCPCLASRDGKVSRLASARGPVFGDREERFEARWFSSFDSY